MKRLATLCLPLLLGLTATAFASNQAPPQSGYDALQGTWELVSGVRDGVALGDQDVATSILIAQGNTYKLPLNAAIGTSVSGTFKIDTTTTPYQVESTPADGPQAGQVMLGIYKLEGDLQTVVFAQPGRPRPTEFTSVAGSGDLLQVWRRLSPTAIDPSLARYFGAVERAYAARDAAAFAAEFSVDGDLVDALGVRSVGRPAIQSTMQRMFTSSFQSGVALASLDSVRLIGADEALVDATWTLGSVSGGFPSRSQAFYVLQRQGDGWLAVAARAYQSR